MENVIESVVNDFKSFGELAECVKRKISHIKDLNTIKLWNEFLDEIIECDEHSRNEGWSEVEQVFEIQRLANCITKLTNYYHALECENDFNNDEKKVTTYTTLEELLNVVKSKEKCVFSNIKHKEKITIFRNELSLIVKKSTDKKWNAKNLDEKLKFYSEKYAKILNEINLSETLAPENKINEKTVPIIEMPLPFKIEKAQSGQEPTLIPVQVEKADHRLKQSLSQKIDEILKGAQLLMEATSFTEIMIPFKFYGLQYNVCVEKMKLPEQNSWKTYIKYFSINTEKPIQVPHNMKIDKIVHLFIRYYFITQIKMVIDAKTKSLKLFPNAKTEILSNGTVILNLDGGDWSRVEYIFKDKGEEEYRSRLCSFALTPDLTPETVAMKLSEHVSGIIAGASTEKVSLGFIDEICNTYKYLNSVLKTPIEVDKGGVDLRVFDNCEREILVQIKTSHDYGYRIKEEENKKRKILYLYVDKRIKLPEFSNHFMAGCMAYFV